MRGAGPSKALCGLGRIQPVFVGAGRSRLNKFKGKPAQNKVGVQGNVQMEMLEGSLEQEKGNWSKEQWMLLVKD